MSRSKIEILKIATTLAAATLAVLSLVMPSPAKEKEKGAEVLIQTRDGRGIRAELLAVKEGRMILMESSTQTEVTMEIGEVKSIQIVKRSSFFRGLGLGLLSGGICGAALGFLSGDDPPGCCFSFSAEAKAALGALGLGFAGGSIGGIAGIINGIDESVDLEGRSAQDIQRILLKLDAKSRFPQQPSRNIQPPASTPLRASANKAAIAPIPVGESRPERPFAQNISPAKFSRFHLTYRPGYFCSTGVNDDANLFQGIGFGDTEPAHELTFFFFSLGTVPATPYPRITKGASVNFGEVRMEYSLTPKFAVGVGYSSLGEHEVKGYKKIMIYRGGAEYYSNLFLIESYSGDLYYVMGSWMTVPDAFLTKYSLKLGTGVGWGSFRINYQTSKYSFGADDHVHFSKTALVLIGTAEVNRYFNRNWSLGFNAEYRYVPLKIGSFHLTGLYYDLDENSQLIESSMPVSAPGHTMNFGGYGFGINIGFHF